VPWPNDVVTRTVVGTYLTGLGTPAKGRVTFTPTSRVVDADDAVVIEDTLTAVLNTLGAFEIDLPTTDNALLSPEGWAYDVSVRLYGVKPQHFYAFLPYGDGSDVDIRTDISLVGTGTPTVSSSTGATGPIGPRGPGVIIGEGLPTDGDGFNGDIYIDSDSGSYYGPKTAGEWSDAPVYTAGNTRRKVHTQASVSAQWVITHDLGGRPAVTIVDSAGTVVVGDVSYNSNTQVTISFTAPFSGYAYLT
jgi:hypothetical protein